MTTPSGILVTAARESGIIPNSGLPKFAPLVARTSLGPIIIESDSILKR